VGRIESFTGARTKKENDKRKRLRFKVKSIGIALGFAATGADGLAKLLGVIKSINNG